jgi:hypothetical protein
MTIYRRSRVAFTPETLEEARRRYEQTDETQISIAASLGIDRNTLTRVARTKGWLQRKDRPPYDLPQVFTIDAQATDAVATLAAAAPGDPGAAAKAGSIADRLEAALGNELRKVENQRAARGNAIQRSIDDERLARTLSMLTETLVKVRRLRHISGNLQATDDDNFPADADEFRIDLARRIEMFVRSRADGSVSGASEPAGGDAAQS